MSLSALGGFWSSILVLFILGIMITISFAINSIFMDLRSHVIDIHNRLRGDLAYFGFLFVLLFLLIFLYKGSLSSSAMRQVIKLA